MALFAAIGEYCKAVSYNSTIIRFKIILEYEDKVF